MKIKGRPRARDGPFALRQIEDPPPAPRRYTGNSVEDAAIAGETHKAHGLEGLLEEPDWPVLTLAEVDRVLRRYPQAGGALQLLSFSPRPFSAGSVVATPLGKVFVKRHASAVRDRAGLMEEHGIMAWLAARSGDLVQAPLIDADGETVVEDEEWTYEVHPFARGADVYEDALSWTPFRHVGHARAAGRAMAVLHRAAEGYDAPARKPQHLVASFSIFAGDDPMRGMDEYLQLRPQLQAYAEQRNWRGSFDDLFLGYFDRLAPYLRDLKPLWTQNDLHSSNLTWLSPDKEAEVSGVIDFGLADRTNAVHDLATAIERNTIVWLRMDESGAELVRLDQIDALLAGYEELHPLSNPEAHALISVLPLVHCEFALSETDYFLSILHSPEKASLAYEGYFLAHARWFGSRQGRMLLEHLERWADSRPRANGGTK